MLELSENLALGIERSIRPLIGNKKSADVLYIGADGTPTKRIDDVAEKAAIDFLKSTDIPMVVLSEEKGRVLLDEDPEYICVLDPLDGTVNAIKNIPIYNTSIAFAPYKEDATLEDIEYGLVMDLFNNNIFKAEKGERAMMNGKEITASDTEEIEKSTLSLYIKPGELKTVEALIKKSKRIRCLGSVALELCYVANGGYEGMIDLRHLLKVTDIAAGKIMVEESGGVVSDSKGNILNYGLQTLDRVEIIASANVEIHENVLSVLRH
ncbi:MAG: bifunctional fructose-bisphosphatase/inositol-phosphate phosphatase [Candidatus Hydrothermarchaeales archaeon]